MPTQQLFDLIIDHSVAFVALTLVMERALFAAQLYLKDDWFYFSERLLMVIDGVPIPKVAAATLAAVVLRSIYHLVSYYLHWP